MTTTTMQHGGLWTMWTLGTSALLACLVACSGGIAPVGGGDGDGGGGGGGDGGGGADGGGGGSCMTSPLPLKRVCVPATAKAGVEITVQADGEGCLGCGTTVLPCKVEIVGKQIRLGGQMQSCTIPDGLGCPAFCGLPQPRCTIPPLPAGDYTIELTTGVRSSDEPTRRLVVSATATATSCDLPQGIDGPKPIVAASFAQTCGVDEDCVAVTEGDVCQACACPNAAIAKSAKDSYDGEVRAKQSLCTSGGGAACAACQERKAKCGTGGKCVIVAL